MKNTLLTFIICLSLSEVALGQYVFTIADLQMLANAKTPALVKTYAQSKGYTFLQKEVQNGTTFYTYAIAG